MRSESLFLTALVFGLSMLAIACAPEQADQSAGSDQSADAAPSGPAAATQEVAGARATPPQVTPELPLAGDTSAADPRVTVSDQFVRDGRIVVDQAIVPEDGWVVIHETLADGAPGDVVGRAQVGTQLSIQVPVQLERTFDGPTQLVAMLHQDSGDPESFDFPDGDPPFTKNGRPVIDRFTVRPSQ